MTGPLKTPIDREVALELAEEAIGNPHRPFAFVILRARVADLVQRVDEKSREDAHAPIPHDETACRYCIAIAEQRSNEKYEEDRAS